jgi:hypothetical protein
MKVCHLVLFYRKLATLYVDVYSLYPTSISSDHAVTNSERSLRQLRITVRHTEGTVADE